MKHHLLFDGSIPDTIAAAMRIYRKTAILWARTATTGEVVHTLEGIEKADAGDMVCRGLQDELWCQSAENLHVKYDSTGLQDGVWTQYRPKPNAPLVNAIPIDEPFEVQTSWGKLTGQAGDYLVQSQRAPADLWIVAREIFEATYEEANPTQ